MPKKALSCCKIFWWRGSAYNIFLHRSSAPDRELPGVCCWLPHCRPLPANCGCACGWGCGCGVRVRVRVRVRVQVCQLTRRAGA